MIGRWPFAIAVVIVLLSRGCATGPVVGRAGDGPSVEMLVLDGEGSYARFLADGEGTLHFAGGLDALDRRFKWSGPLTGDELATLHTLLARDGWGESDAPSTGVSPEREYRITVIDEGRRRSFTVTGDSPEVVAVYDVLETAARRRYDAFLETLPQPGEQTSQGSRR